MLSLWFYTTLTQPDHQINCLDYMTGARHFAEQPIMVGSDQRFRIYVTVDKMQVFGEHLLQFSSVVHQQGIVEGRSVIAFAISPSDLFWKDAVQGATHDNPSVSIV